jgi:hypothetical protein
MTYMIRVTWGWGDRPLYYAIPESVDLLREHIRGHCSPASYVERLLARVDALIAEAKERSAHKTEESTHEGA